ncbi:replication initiation protein [Rugamonas sp. A1-17]|nr:replication initiation protein [Rugamonas sp. A1-17]
MDESRQLALMLFDTLSPQGRSVDAAPKALGFRRSNAFVRIVDLSLAGRRLVDVAYFLVASEPELKKEYRVDYGLFKWLLATTSENRAHLKKLIREAQKAAIELNGPDVQDEASQPWGSVPLMGPAFIAGGEFIFELPERLQKAIKNPQATHFLSLRYVFKSIYSKILYDRLQPYMDEGVTPWFDLEALRVWLECEKKTYSLFKHFRNKVLDVAVNEIAEVTGLKVVMVTQNVPGSKKIGHVRFKWDTSQQTDEQKTAFVVLKNTYETLRSEFGLNQSDFDEIVRNRTTFTDDHIQQAMEYTRHQVSAGKVKLRAGGYFMKALSEGYLIGSLDKEIQERSAGVKLASARGEKTKIGREVSADKEFTARQQKESQLGWTSFQTLSAEDQQTLTSEFCKLATAPMIARSLQIEVSELVNHLDNPKVSPSFGSYVANRLQKAAKATKGDNSGNLFSDGSKAA